MASLQVEQNIRFQSTHPVRGATYCNQYPRVMCEHFNPRTP